MRLETIIYITERIKNKREIGGSLSKLHSVLYNIFYVEIHLLFYFYSNHGMTSFISCSAFTKFRAFELPPKQDLV